MAHRENAGFLTPWGWGKVWVTDGRPSKVILPRVNGDEGAREWEEAWGEDGAGAWARRLERFLASGVPQWEGNEVDLALIGADGFRARVYRELMEVPPGSTVSYGVLAELAGSPRAGRAVGTAMAENPLPLVIPCHRVIRANGCLGEFGSGVEWKQFLLALEGWRGGAEG